MTIAQESQEHVIPGEYIVQLRSNSEISKLVAEYPHIEIKQCLSKHMNIWLLKSDEPDMLNRLNQSSGVRVAQCNHNNVTHRALIPNDSLFNVQWNMYNTSPAGADISATEAWQMNHGAVTQAGDSIVVAVIDGGLGSGFDLHHPDLNFFVNRHEIPNNGRDDDGNGYIDDYRGWNVFGLNDSVDNNSDEHATHVSGIVGAIGNNAKGVAGVCWGAKILAVNGSSNTESDVVMAYDYVLEMRRLYDQTAGAKGAFVVATNSSFGIDMESASAHPIWCAMYDSLGALGILSAAATANSAWNVDDVGDMPTTCPSRWLIAVTNTMRNDVINSQAAYGPVNIDLGAPGTIITSCFNYDGYGVISGSSMASPHVAGAVAGMMANACPALLQAYFTHPDSMALLLKDYMLRSVDPLPSLLHRTVSGGRLNLYHAFIAEESYNCNNCHYNASISQQNLTCYGDSSGSIIVTAGSSNGAYHYLWSNGATSSQLTNLGSGYYQVTVTDTSGCQRQLSTLIPAPAHVIISSINVIPLGTDTFGHTIPGNIIVSASAGADTLSYAMDTGGYQSSAIFVTSVPGVHVIHIRNQSGCETDTAVGIFYTGISDNSIISAVSLSPNPVSGICTLSISSNGTLDAEGQVHDMTGRMVSTHVIHISTGVQQSQIDMSMLANGIYLMTINNAGSPLAEIKVLVMH